MKLLINNKKNMSFIRQTENKSPYREYQDGVESQDTKYNQCKNEECDCEDSENEECDCDLEVPNCFCGECPHDWSEMQSTTIQGVFIIYQQCSICKLINKL